MTPSKQFSLNDVDRANLLKNILIFGIPLFIANLAGVQNFILAHSSINAETVAFILSLFVKVGQYYLDGAKKEPISSISSSKKSK